jgi:uncharacterized protein GlcG (DUF336 family)
MDITLLQAESLIKKAESIARQIDVPMNIAILDTENVLVTG